VIARKCFTGRVGKGIGALGEIYVARVGRGLVGWCLD
jgi:hypothetical protein